MSRNIFHCHWILDRQPMVLTFHSSPVDEYATIGVESYTNHVAESLEKNYTLTGECEAYVIIQHDNLANRSRILELKHGLLLYTQHHNILTADSDLHTSHLESFSRGN